MKGVKVQAAVRSPDQRLEAAIGRMLRIGVTLAALVVLSGGALYLLQAHAPVPDYTHFRSSPEEARSIGGTFAGVAKGSPVSIIQLGILLLIATPVVRVALALAGFLVERDWLYTAVGTIVLAILLFSLIHSR